MSLLLLFKTVGLGVCMPNIFPESIVFLLHILKLMDSVFMAFSVCNIDDRTDSPESHYIIVGEVDDHAHAHAP